MIFFVLFLHSGWTPNKKSPSPSSLAYSFASFYFSTESPLCNVHHSYLASVHKPLMKKPNSVMNPITPKLKVNILPCVQILDPGGSYNPSFEDHQFSLNRAHGVETHRMEQIQRRRTRMAYPKELDLLVSRHFLSLSIHPLFLAFFSLSLSHIPICLLSSSFW